MLSFQISNSDTLSSTQNDNLTSGYTQRGVSSTNVQQSGSNVGVSMNNSTNSTLDQLSKSDPYNQSNTSNANVYQSSYSSNATTNKTPSYQPSGAGQGYNSTNYTNSQVCLLVIVYISLFHILTGFDYNKWGFETFSPHHRVPTNHHPIITMLIIKIRWIHTRRKAKHLLTALQTLWVV